MGGRTGEETPRVSLPQPHGRMCLPSTLQQPELAELWDLEGRLDPNRRQRGGSRASEPVHSGVSALLPSKGRGLPWTHVSAAGQTLLPRRLTGWHCHLFLEGPSSPAVLPPSSQPSETPSAPPSLARLEVYLASRFPTSLRAKGFCLHSSFRARASG